jgi:hypothetical protein
MTGGGVCIGGVVASAPLPSPNSRGTSGKPADSILQLKMTVTYAE